MVLHGFEQTIQGGQKTVHFSMHHIDAVKIVSVHYESLTLHLGTYRPFQAARHVKWCLSSTAIVLKEVFGCSLFFIVTHSM